MPGIVSYTNLETVARFNYGQLRQFRGAIIRAFLKTFKVVSIIDHAHYGRGEGCLLKKC